MPWGRTVLTHQTYSTAFQAFPLLATKGIGVSNHHIPPMLSFITKCCVVVLVALLDCKRLKILNLGQLCSLRNTCWCLRDLFGCHTVGWGRLGEQHY